MGGQDQKQEQAAPQTAAEKAQEFRTYATALTMQRLSPDLQKLLSVAAGRDVFVIAPGDIPETRIEADPNNPEKEEWEYVGRTLDFMVKAGYPADRLPDLNNVERLLMLHETSAIASADFMALRHDALGPGFIFAGPLRPGNELAAMLAGGLPEGMLANIPDPGGKSWEILSYAHEAAHLRQPEPRSAEEMIETLFRNDPPHKIIPFETDADIRGIWSYSGLYAGLLSPYITQTVDPAVPAAWEAMRAIGSLRQSGNFLQDNAVSHSTHATNGGYDVIRGVAVPTEMTPQEAAAGALTVNSYAHALLGRVSGPLTGDEKEAMTAMWTSAMGQNQPDILAKNFKEHLMSREDGPAIAAALVRGNNEAAENPLHHYAAVKILYDRGVFDKDPAAHTMAGEFIAAFEKYVPAIHEQDLQAYLGALSHDTETIDKTLADPALKALIDGIRRDLLEDRPALSARPLPSGPGV